MKQLKFHLSTMAHYLKGSSRYMSLHILSGVLSVGCMLLYVWLCKAVIDLATQPGGGSFTPYVLGLAVTLLTQVGLNYASGYCENRCEIENKNQLRAKLFHSILGCCWYDRERFHTGDLVNRMEEDVRVVSEALASLIPTICINLTKLLGAFLLMTFLEWRVAIGVVLVMPICCLLVKRYGSKLNRLTKHIRKSDGQIHSLLQESLQHRFLITTFLAADRQTEKLHQKQEKLRGKFMKRSHYSLTSRSVTYMGFAVGYFFAFLYGATLLRDGLITFGTLTAFLQLVSQVQHPTLALITSGSKFIQAYSSMQRIDELKQLPSEVHRHDKESSIQAVGIRFNQVSFAYEQSCKKIFQEFTTDFKPYTMTAILGETGVGKSTLFRFIMAILTPESGEVVCYNQQGESKQVTPAFRKQVAYVPQGNSLFSGTIRENLLWAHPQATSNEIEEALHTAVAHFVYELPKGLDTPCGEGGARLSEGQAQRIAIARALLGNRSILLFDEFSSALDAATERLLMERLKAACQQRTLLLITHREEIAMACQGILRLPA
ncbi:MAG: ABC transporter ATP-binding protein [Phocaeicola sp.]